MTALLRLLPGAGLMLAFGAATVLITTYPSRSRLTSVEIDAGDIAQREEQLIQRMVLLRSTENGVSIPDEAVWRGQDAASVEIALQQAVVAAAGQAGLQLISFGATALTDGPSHPTIAYELELSGGHDGVAGFLADLEGMRPALAVSYLWIRQLPPDQTQPVAPVSLRMTVWGFREPLTASP
jgi:hypothetical protein